LRGARLAKLICDRTDDRKRYYDPGNVQSTPARTGLASFTAYRHILINMVLPLDLEKEDETYDWLLRGTKDEMSMISGCTGICPYVIHTMGQVTHFTIKMKKVVMTALRVPPPCSFQTVRPFI